jgi:spoIIIJ-associated protein
VEWVETTGRTLEEAKDAALDQLGVGEDDAEFEVLEEARKGLFGLLGAEARVRARVRPTAPRPKLDRRDRRRRRPAKDEHDEGETRAPAPPPAKATEGETTTMTEDLTVAEQGEEARQFVVGLLSAFGLEASVAVQEVDDETVEVSVTGEDLGLLIGPKGQTLAAIQDLTRTSVQRHVEGRYARLNVDVAGYRQKRREALARFTRQVAEQVLASGERKVLEPMAPPDRKVVHDTANEIEGVTTTSEGEEPRRRVVLLPDPDAPAAG